MFPSPMAGRTCVTDSGLIPCSASRPTIVGSSHVALGATARSTGAGNPRPASIGRWYSALRASISPRTRCSITSRDRPALPIAGTMSRRTRADAMSPSSAAAETSIPCLDMASAAAVFSAFLKDVTVTVFVCESVATTPITLDTLAPRSWSSNLFGSYSGGCASCHRSSAASKVCATGAIAWSEIEPSGPRSICASIGIMDWIARMLAALVDESVWLNEKPLICAAESGLSSSGAMPARNRSPRSLSALVPRRSANIASRSLDGTVCVCATTLAAATGSTIFPPRTALVRAITSSHAGAPGARITLLASTSSVTDSAFLAASTLSSSARRSSHSSPSIASPTCNHAGFAMSNDASESSSSFSIFSRSPVLAYSVTIRLRRFCFVVRTQASFAASRSSGSMSPSASVASSTKFEPGTLAAALTIFVMTGPWSAAFLDVYAW